MAFERQIGVHLRREEHIAAISRRVEESKEPIDDNSGHRKNKLGDADDGSPLEHFVIVKDRKKAVNVITWPEIHQNDPAFKVCFGKILRLNDQVLMNYTIRTGVNAY